MKPGMPLESGRVRVKAGMLLEAGGALPRDLAWLAPGERERLAGMRVPRRRHDFRRGRWTAKRALARALGLSSAPEVLAELEIAAGDRGAPVPERRGRRLECELSISHRKGAALCVVGARHARIGCDVEWVEPRSRAFELHFLTTGERRWLDTLSPAARAEGANLVWSAKESVVKALRTGLDVDVRALHLRLASGCDRRFEVDVPGVSEPLQGRWGRHAGWVWTVASVDPHGFDGPAWGRTYARPRESWGSLHHPPRLEARVAFMSDG